MGGTGNGALQVEVVTGAKDAGEGGVSGGRRCVEDPYGWSTDSKGRSDGKAGARHVKDQFLHTYSLEPHHVQTCI